MASVNHCQLLEVPRVSLTQSCSIRNTRGKILLNLYANYLFQHSHWCCVVQVSAIDHKVQLPVLDEWPIGQETMNVRRWRQAMLQGIWRFSPTRKGQWTIREPLCVMHLGVICVLEMLSVNSPYFNNSLSPVFRCQDSPAAVLSQTQPARINVSQVAFSAANETHHSCYCHTCQTDNRLQWFSWSSWSL